MSSKNKNNAMRDLVFRFSAMYPMLSIDTITAAVLSEDGHFERALVLLNREVARLPPAPVVTSEERKAAVADLLSQRELALLEMATPEVANEVENGDGVLDSVDLRQSNDVKYGHYEAVVLGLAESFPHVPLDDVWTAVIVNKGSRVEAAASLLEFEEPVTPVTVPLADRRELDHLASRDAQKRPAEKRPASAAAAAAAQFALRESLDAAGDNPVVINGEQLPLVLETTETVGPSPDELLALALQREEDEAANLRAIQQLERQKLW
jgi:hypothetical protein